MTTTTASGSPVGSSSAPADSHPIAFQQLCRDRAALAVDWLLRSIRACDGRGSAAFYSRWYRPVRGWTAAYPETTGYIIPTLLRFARRHNREDCHELALRQADWLLTLQFAEGGFPGGFADGRPWPPSIFNTGQILFGLCAAADASGGQRYLDAAVRAARWLAEQVDAAAGTWTSYAYVSGYSPAYYTRVCWPMLEVERRSPETGVRTAAAHVLETIAGWALNNGAWRNWAFKPGAPAFTHTIAYTLRGALESAWLLGDAAGDRLERVVCRSAEALMRRAELRGRLAGAYDEQMRGRYWYSCLTGNCQMAIVWMRLYQRHGDARYLSAALKALQFTIDRQRVRAIDPNVRGAIAGSAPFWGRYLILRYPNWAAKFFVDALTLADDLLGQAPP